MNSRRVKAVLCGVALWAGAAMAQQPFLTPEASRISADAFELDLYKRRFEQEMKFRAAALHVAWGAENLCDHTTEIEPFVLWSVHAMRKPLSGRQDNLFRRATGMDEKWRVAWADESVPDELKVGDVVVAINGIALPGGSTKVEFNAIFSGRSVVSADDQAYWEVIQQARDKSVSGEPMVLHLEDGRQVPVATQTGCAGSVTASSFDSDPDKFWRQGNERAKIPANAMLEARTEDELRWLAAFGTFFQASDDAVGRQQAASTMATAFTVGRVLTFLVPGAGMILSAAEAQAERSIAVDGIIGSADLFANEVVTALGGDPGAGLKLMRRLLDAGIKTDVFQPSEFRLGSMELHVKKLREIQAAQEKAQREGAKPG